jgi:methionyl-tRNA synthetase
MTAGPPPRTIKHKRVVQAMLQKLHDCGQLYKKSYAGFYSVRQEQFLTDKERGSDGQYGEEWGEVVELEEENWYFRLSDHVEWLKNHIRGHPDFIFPPHRANDVLNSLEGRAGPVHQPSHRAPELGHSPALRRKIRELRVVRCAGELHQLRRLHGR